jgi:glycosyltransferase involved in cell wall biosynthesis
MSIPGNIRREKNYEVAIEALTQLPDFVLLIAGAPANARLDLSGYKTLAASSAVTDRVIWIEHYLSASELSAVLAVTDVLVLNYADSFTSQSGILNVAANFRKPLVVSDGRSSLVSVVRNFGIGTIVNGTGPELLASAIRSTVSNCAQKQNAWDSYLKHASWEKHTSLAVNLFKELR